MSKKKASTMTLRDFHGGNIPSDLPLPSAPGMTVERKNHDRPGSGGWMGSSLHRGYGTDRVGFSRQGSGNSARSFEEKMPYLPNSANIGRNYDEDERKPVDGHNRRGQSPDIYDEPIFEHRQVGHERLPERYLDSRSVYTPQKPVDLRSERHVQEDMSPALAGSSSFRTESFSRRTVVYQPDSTAHAYLSQEHPSHYVSQHAAPSSPYQVQESAQPWRQSSPGLQQVTPGTVMGTGTGVQNVWTAGKDGDYSKTYPNEYHAVESATVLASGSRIAQASALEKVSSGRWNSRILQANENLINPVEFSHSYGVGYEGGGSFTHSNAKPLVEHDQKIMYDDRTAYVESGRAIESVSSRDARFHTDKMSHQANRNEQYIEGRGMGQTDNRFVDDRHVYGESGQKGISVTPRESARFTGLSDGQFREPIHHKATNQQYNEAPAYLESRNIVQSSSGWVRSEPSPRREYVEGYSVDSTKGPSLEFEKRGFYARDAPMDTEYGAPQRGVGLEGRRDRGTYLDGTYAAGKDDTEYLNSPYVNSRDDFPQEASDSSRSGRIHDRSRVSDVEQSYPARLHSPGSVRTPQESAGASGNLMVDQGKAIPAERPKLKLLPRTKPLEADTFEDVAQEASRERVDAAQRTRAEGVGGNEESGRVLERPKLTLKPRSQPVDVVPTESRSLKDRKSVFGGARPRELVLRERGVEESVIVGGEFMPSPAPSSSSVRTPVEANRNSNRGGVGYGMDKQDKPDERSKRGDQHDGRMGRQDSGRFEQMDSRGRSYIDSEKKDERRSFEHRQHHQEKRESDRPDVDKQESWRRPADFPQSPLTVGEMSPATVGRPIQSAAELAQAFSRSTSLGASFGAGQGYSSQRSPLPRSPGPGFGISPDTSGLRKNEVPFSRLTETVSPGSRDLRISGAQGGYRRTSAF
ncbi:hypothetical protein KP509_04G074000 [Ceratopteris richardii]|uniref:Uncharacterized protein n=1 Tax=Ceratopteris richardii TaxID=49495 RepID=A0A8T2V195_CERRI|nr:hypothetical protein KP509_04G074000 [Ceratopteris richardii]KAH7439736.1 hypothetical protein KP509_04G074000 [Ceratopteris richardii]